VTTVDRGTTAGGPLRAVLRAVDDGAATVAGLVHATGLPRDVVVAAVEHLTRTGRFASLPPRCPPTGCRGCAVVDADLMPCPPGRGG
jgi:hypothetical protein